MAQLKDSLISGEVSTTIYSKGDTCLLINPFDTFHLFTLYKDWLSDNPTTLDVSGDEPIFELVFKSKNKEVRVSEYNVPNTDLTIDKTQGQLLFRLSKEQATKILALPTNIFYIIRYYQKTDNYGSIVSKSDEEVVYVGKWCDESTYNQTALSVQIKELQNTLKTANAKIVDLENTNAELTLSIARLTDSIENWKSMYDSLQKELEEKDARILDLEKQVGNTYSSATVISKDASYSFSSYNIAGTDYSEDQLLQLAKMNQIDVTDTTNTTLEDIAKQLSKKLDSSKNYTEVSGEDTTNTSTKSTTSTCVNTCVNTKLSK